MGFHLHLASEVSKADMHLRKKTLLAASLILTYLFAIAGNGLLASEIKDVGEFRFKGVRAMGMGDAFAAIANDADAFYYNPAGLAAVTNIRVDLQPVRFIPTHDLYGQLRGLRQLRDDIRALNESEEPLEDPELEDERRRLMERIERLLGDDLGLDAGAPARIIVPFHIGNYAVSVGAYTHGWSVSRVEVQRRGLDWSDFVKDMLDDEIYYDAMAETSYGAAVAVEAPVPPLPLELSFGIAARRIWRWGITDKDDLMGLDDILSDDFAERYYDPEDPWDSVSEGNGYSVDIGAIGSLNDAISFAIVAQDLMGNVKYERGPDDELPTNVDFSSAINLTRLMGPVISSLDVVLAAGIDSSEEARLGLELIWDLPLLELSGRIGSNDGHTTLGAGIQFAFLDFDYAFYGDRDADWHAFSLNLAF